MSISIGDKPEQNVVNVGDEISSDQLAAITGASDPTASNPFVTTSTIQEGTNIYTEISAGSVETGSPAMGSVVNVGNSQITLGDGTETAITLDYLGGITCSSITFPDETVLTTAGGGGGGGSYLPLAGGTMTGDIIFGTAGQYIGEGNFDTERGGVNGLSLVCSVGYEFNWQAGWLTTTEQNSATPRPLYLDGEAGTSLRVWQSSVNSGATLTVDDLIFGTTVVEDSETWANVIFNNNGVTWSDWEFGTKSYYQPLGFQLFGLGTNNPINIIGGFSSENPYISLQPDYGAGGSGGNVPMKIDGFGLTFPDGTTQVTATVGTGDQTLATTDDVVFHQVDVLDSTATTYTSYISNDEVKVAHDAGGGGVIEHSLLTSSALTHFSSPDGGSTMNTVTLNTTGIVFSGSAFTGITFPDSSVLTTAPVAFDQALNTSDSVGFIGVSTNGLTLTNIASAGTGITFADATTQTSAPVYSASTVLTGGTGSNLKSDDYPHEIRISIGGVTYAMPARVIP